MKFPGPAAILRRWLLCQSLGMGEVRVNPVHLCLAASCASAVHSPHPGTCDMLNLPFHLSWPQAPHWLPKVALTLGGLFVFSLP